MKKSFVIAIAAVFLALGGLFYWMKTAYPAFNFTVLMWGNAIMALLSYISHFLVTRQMNSKPDAFVRGVYASSFLKLFVCMVSILVYVMVNKPNIHKPSLWVLLGIYAVYSIVETWLSSKIARETK